MRTVIACCLAFLVLVINGCSSADKVPSGILSKDKMEAVCWDMIQADQYAASYLIKDSSKVNLKLENLRLYEEVFRLHQVSREEFAKSYKYYLAHTTLSETL